jgi:ligand-binding sensor domain-containing protein
MLYNRVILFFLLILIGYGTSAQQFVNGFKRFGEAEGVPNANNYKIFESSDHFLWLSTEAGLYRFDGYQFTPYFSKKNDSTTLSSNVIGDIEEDRFGNLWVSTFGKGVNKLDKKTGKWKQYLRPSIDENWFYWVFDFFKDRQGRLWLGTNGRGLLLYNEKTDSFNQFIPDSTKSKNGVIRFENEVRGIAADASSADVLWLAGTDGLYHFDTKSKNFICYKNVKNGKAEWINNSFHTIHVQDANNIWLGAWGGGLIHFNILTKKFTNYPPSPQEYSKQNFARNIFTKIDYCSDTSLYVSTAEGFFEFNHKQKKFLLISVAKNQLEKNLSQLFNGITHTSDGSTWVCSEGNIFQKNAVYQRMGLFQSFYQPKGKYVYEPSLSSVLYRKASKQYWMSCNAGYGIYVFDKNFHYLRSIAIENNAVDRRLRDIVEDALGNIWLRSRDAPFLYYYDKAKDQFLNAAPTFEDAAFITSGIIEMKADKKGNVWFVNNKQLLKWDPLKRLLQTFSFNGFKKTSIGWVQTVLKFDSNNNPWLASNIGLYHYNQTNAKWQQLFSEPNNNTSVTNAFVESFTIDLQGNCWIALLDEEIQVYNPTSKKIINDFAQPKDFILHRIHGLETDNKGNIWATTSGGLAQYNAKERKWYSYTKEDGLVTNNIYDAHFAMDDGTIILASQYGFTHWNIDSFPTNNKKPIVYFNRFISGGKEIVVENNAIYLPASANEMTVDFGAIATVMGDRTKFYYTILPQQKEWIATTQRSISLAAITSGEYTLFVKAINADGIESEVKQIKISVAFPFWKTWWFKLLCLILVVGLLYAISKWRINIIRKEEKNKAILKSQITEMEMMALRSQMNPHFIFNCINSIDALIQSNDKYSATMYLNKFAKLLRNILDSSKQNTVLFSKDVEALKLYIALEELRHENKFKPKFIIDVELLNSDYKVPPLIVQPYVENAILHGIGNREGNDGILTIEIKKVNDTIQYIITDNGIGREAAEKIRQNKESHYGMQMSYDRVKLFNKEEMASVHIKDLYSNNVPMGTSIEVNLKII